MLQGKEKNLTMASLQNIGGGAPPCSLIVGAPATKFNRVLLLLESQIAITKDIENL